MKTDRLGEETRREEDDANHGPVRFSLYDSFVFSFVVAEFPFSSIAVVHQLPGEDLSSRLLGVELTFIENEEDALVSAFNVVEKYCRLRLPEKYLTAFDVPLTERVRDAVPEVGLLVLAGLSIT